MASHEATDVPFTVGERGNGLAWNLAEDVLAVVGGEHLTLFDEKGGCVRRTRIGYAFDVCFHPTEPILAASFQGSSVGLFNANDSSMFAMLKDPAWGGIRRVAFSPDGRLLASGSDGCSVCIWDWKASKLLETFKDPEDVNGLAWLSDSRRLLIATDKAVTEIDVHTKKKRTAKVGGVADVCLSPDESTIAAAGNGVFVLLNRSLAVTARLKQPGVSRLRFSKDGSALYAASWEGRCCGVTRWDLRSRKAFAFAGHESSPVWGLALKPGDGSVFAAGDLGGVFVWDAAGESRCPTTGVPPKATRRQMVVVDEPAVAAPVEPPPPEPPPATRKELDAAETRCLEQLVAACTLVPYEEALALLRTRKLHNAEWLPGEASTGVLVHRGDLTLDALRLDHREDGIQDGLIVDGNLEVGLVENGEQDFGPFLVVLGDIVAKNIAVAGAPIEVLGGLKVTGTFHGFYNHGITRVHGDTDVNLLIADDYLCLLKGTVTGAVLGSVKGKLGRDRPKAKDLLHPAFFEEDGNDVSFKSDDIYKQVTCGGSVRV
jgi:WD40 repeat protein